MKRRHFVGAASVGLAAALWPAFVREAFGDGPACNGGPLARVAGVAAAFRRAREASKPLLILVIPADDRAKYDRGQAFGELINHGADRDLAPLARAEVLCATMDDLRKLVPTVGAGDPLMVLVSADKVPATARQLDVELPTSTFDEDRDWKDRERKDDVLSNKRIAIMGELLRRALGIDEKRAAALATEARARLKDKPPPGTRWASSSGCGTDIEGEAPMAVGCGMGHVPKKAQRFLYFFTQRVL